MMNYATRNGIGDRSLTTPARMRYGSGNSGSSNSGMKNNMLYEQQQQQQQYDDPPVFMMVDDSYESTISNPQHHQQRHRHDYNYVKENLIMFGDGLAPPNGDDAPTASTGLSQEELLQRKRREDTWRKRKEKRSQQKKQNRLINLPSSLFSTHSTSRQQHVHQQQNHLQYDYSQQQQQPSTPSQQQQQQKQYQGVYKDIDMVNESMTRNKNTTGTASSSSSNRTTTPKIQPKELETKFPDKGLVGMTDYSTTAKRGKTSSSGSGGGGGSSSSKQDSVDSTNVVRNGNAVGKGVRATMVSAFIRKFFIRSQGFSFFLSNFSFSFFPFSMANCTNRFDDNVMIVHPQVGVGKYFPVLPVGVMVVRAGKRILLHLQLRPK